MNTTPNLGLKKPLQTEFYNVDDFNYNADTIDQAIHDLSENKQDKLSTSQLNAVNSGITSAKVSKLDALPTSTQLDGNLSSKANKSDITNISITGSANNTGSNILAGTLFYLNGTLCKILVDVSNGATFTEGTNYTIYSISDSQTYNRTDVGFNTNLGNGILTSVKIGNRVSVTLSMQSNSQIIGTNDILAVVPVEYRPHETMSQKLAVYKVGADGTFIFSGAENAFLLFSDGTVKENATGEMPTGSMILCQFEYAI